MKIAIGQFGGPTTVFNTSLYGALSVLTSHPKASSTQCYGLLNGVAGLLEGRFEPLPTAYPWLLDTPGAVLGSSRFRGFPEVAERAVMQLRKHGIDGFLAIGGNGTMALAKTVEDVARTLGVPLQVIGVPKTIDNDIVQIDHSPGYPSAARFVIKAVRDLTIDLEAMAGFEQVRVVEVMGRHGGWLAAAAALVPHLTKGPWHTPAPIICIPEQPLRVPELLGRIHRRVLANGYALVVVSEGVQDDLGNKVLQSGSIEGGSADSILGGIGAKVAEYVRRDLGYRVRYENLGLLQRCWSESQSALDREEGKLLGQAGAQALLSGQTGTMVGLVRKAGCETYATELIRVPLDEVAGKDRKLSEQEQRLTDDFLHWLAPLVDLPSIRSHPRLSVSTSES